MSARTRRDLNDPRRSTIAACGPDRVRKRYEEFLSEEYEKARLLAELAATSELSIPRPLRLDVAGSAIEYEYLAHDASAKDLYIDYATCRDHREHRMLPVVRAAARMLARIHALRVLPCAEQWRPSPSFLRNLDHFGYHATALSQEPLVPLHCDFCLQNVAYRMDASGRLQLMVFDPSPDYVQTFHPWTYGPACLDIGAFLSGLDGRLPLRHYVRVKWSRMPRLKREFLDAYNEVAATPVDGDLAAAFAYCVANDYFQAKHATRLMQRLSASLLYNRFKGNLPRAG